MNYKRIYDDIIYKFKNNPELVIGIYSEVHHIIPKCLGGGNTKENLVRVPAREHILLHLLLVKIYPNNNKLLFAANCMINGAGFCKQLTERKEAISRFSTRTIGDIRSQYKQALSKNGIKTIDQKTGKETVSFKAKAAICYDESFNVIRVYSPVNLCELDGFYPTSVCRACRDKIKYANYFWSYKEDFSKEHEEKIIEYESNLVNGGTLPYLDTSYNQLSKHDRLVRRPKRVLSDNTKKLISIANVGKAHNISPEKKAEMYKKAKETRERKIILAELLEFQY